MMEVSDTYILPIVGYRGWVLREGKLSSCVVDNFWIPKKANVAQCDKHHKFWLRCLQSGPLPHLVEWLEHREPGLDLVIGEVYLWGKVVDCEHGYRAQYAYPKRFYSKGYEYSSADNNSTLELREFNVPVEPMPERVTFTSHDRIRRGAPWLSRFAEAFRRLCFP
jgi:hypothetical protein